MHCKNIFKYLFIFSFLIFVILIIFCNSLLDSTIYYILLTINIVMLACSIIFYFYKIKLEDSYNTAIKNLTDEHEYHLQSICFEHEQDLINKEKEIKNQCKYYEYKTMKNINENTNRYFRSLPVCSSAPNFANDEYVFKRIKSAIEENLFFCNTLSIKAVYISQKTNNKYITTLSNCTCKDYQFNKKPCKHMYHLAITFNILDFHSEIHSNQNELKSRIRKINDLEKQLSNINKEIASSNKQIEKEYDKLQKSQKDLKARKREFKKILNEKTQSYPWLAKIYADLVYVKEKEISNSLLEKKRPAYKAAEQIKNISKDKRTLQLKAKEYEYQLNFYESLFPWLEEFKEIPPIKASNYVKISDEHYNDEPIRNWISPEEFKKLSETEKNQLALNRYKKRRKSKWEIGIAYERFVGYKYEEKGYNVKYTGALLGLEDMGRDLIAEKDNKILIIQCKYWSKEKTIHEKHIFQLYGSSVEYNIKYPDKKIEPIFVTTTTLSKQAKKCAEYLNIKVFESYEPEDYPLIKCTVSKNNEKIYHLPFDQQYDNIIINKEKNRTYVETVEQAEKLGYRHAYKWQGDNAEH